jgi:sec-independent protein translocase protein TatB
VFGLSVEHLVILLVAALFILGPQRLPAAAQWLGQGVRRIRGFAADAQEQLRSEMGPEFDEFRKPLQDLSSLRNIDINTAVTRLLADDTAPAPPSSPPPLPNTAVTAVASAQEQSSPSDQPLPPGSHTAFDTEAT